MKAWILPTFVLALAFSAYAQQATTGQTDVSRILTRMSSAKWSERSEAYSDAANMLASGKHEQGDADRLKVGLIQLLATENKATKAFAKQQIAGEDANDESVEAYEEYYAGLVGFVAELGDERAIPALLGAAGTGGMATRGVARFGKKALGVVLEQVASEDARPADDALFVIIEVLRMHTVSDPDSLLKIKNSLRSALASPEHRVRENAISAIEYLGDRQEFVPILQDIAAHDSYKSPNNPENGGNSAESAYRVRKRAQSLLRKIANHEAPAIDQGVDH
jgi:hypothetical protein